MSWISAVVLGLVQGLTEFLPVSSSAHLRIVGELAGFGDPGATFTAVTQIGTELAVVMYFWRDIVRIIRQWCLSLPFISEDKRTDFSDPDVRMGWFVIVGSIPIAVLGLALEDAIDSVFRNLWMTATMLALFAVILGFADMTSKRIRREEDLTWGHAITLGFAQSLALIPGVSRSGGTITAGLLLGYTRKAAARVSFLLAIPAIMASGFYRLLSDEQGMSQAGWGPTMVATAISFVVGYAVIVWFLRLLERRTFAPFVIYRIALAGLIVVLLLTGAINATSALAG